MAASVSVRRRHVAARRANAGNALWRASASNNAAYAARMRQRRRRAAQRAAASKYILKQSLSAAAALRHIGVAASWQPRRAGRGENGGGAAQWHLVCGIMKINACAGERQKHQWLSVTARSARRRRLSRRGGIVGSSASAYLAASAWRRRGNNNARHRGAS